MDLYKTENENRDNILDKLKHYMEHEVINRNCLVDKEIPVPYKHIYFPVRNSLEIWCFKQDICIYQKLFDKSINKSISLSSCGKDILNVTIEKNSSKDKDVGMPFVIVETKMAGTKTEDILATSEKIKMIKSIFPYCKTYLLIFGSPHSRIFRLYSGFDEILFMTDFGNKQCEYILESIKNGFNLGYNIVPYTVSYNYP
jgi:hypothetical protein